MGSLVQRVFVSTAGLIFAVVGFSLSVLATALAALVPVQSIECPVKHPSRGTVRSLNTRGRLVRLSDRPSTSSNSSVPGSSTSAKNTDSDSNTNVSIRSQSSFSFRQHEQPHHPLSNPVPATDSPPLANSTPPPTSRETSREASCQGFTFRKLKPNWGERRPDDKPKIQRCFSSPVHPSPSSPIVRKSSVIVKRKSSKNLRKTASVPSALSPKSCTLEKKKSQPLRTRPYEAPYFFPPPIPVERPPSRGKLPPNRTPPVPPLP